MLALMANIAYAQTFSKVANNPVAGPLITNIVNVIVLPLITLLFVFTVFMFILGVFKLIRSGDDPSARQEGQKHILWGVVGMFIMVCAYGIIRVIANTIGVPDPFF